MNKYKFISGVLIGSMLFMGCAVSKLSTKADKLEQQGQLAQAAEMQEQIAGEHTGMAAAKAWYAAGKLWIDPDNPQKSFKRALTCFYRVDHTKASKQIAADTRLWISILTQLVSAKETGAALKDAAEGSERLRQPAPAIPIK